MDWDVKKCRKTKQQMGRRCGVIGRIPAFQHSGTGLIASGFSDFNLYPRIVCVSFICALSCVVFGGVPDILMTTGTCLVFCCKSHTGEGKKRKTVNFNSRNNFISTPISDWIFGRGDG